MSVALSGNILGSNVWGTVADAHGRRRTLIAVAALSAVTSAMCAFARGYWVRVRRSRTRSMPTWHRLHAASMSAVVLQSC